MCTLRTFLFLGHLSDRPFSFRRPYSGLAVLRHGYGTRSRRLGLRVQCLGRSRIPGCLGDSCGARTEVLHAAVW